jgi:hypothetical protein
LLVLSTAQCGAQPAAPNRLWLVVAASDSTADGIARKARALSLNAAGGLVVQTRDCGDKTNLFAWAPRAATSADSAQSALAAVRKTVKDAYVKRCDVAAGSLLALRITAVDASIAGVPKDAVNWGDEDRISSARPLPDGRTLVIARYFVNKPDDPLEGRRARVILATTSPTRAVLLEDCSNPDGAVTQHGFVALQCATEQAGDHLLHTVFAFDSTGRKVLDLARCRDATWTAEHVLTCKAESVGPDGRLTLVARTARVPADMPLR